MSGTGDGQSAFVDAIDDVDGYLGQYTTHVKRHWKDVPDLLTRWSNFIADAPNTDLVVYRDHGLEWSWGNHGEVKTSNLSTLDFGTKHPMVWSIACLTGDIGASPSLAEAFLERGASVFIGATEVSPRTPNNKFAHYLAKYHTMSAYYPTIGDAFKWAKRKVIDETIYFGSWCYVDARAKQLVNEYNLYGDPKRYETPITKALALSRTEAAGEGAPPDSIELVLPDYEVTTTESGTDYVRFPVEEGGTLDEEGQPIVPIYIYRVTFGPEYKVSDVTLEDRSGLETESGLNLPVASFEDNGGRQAQARSQNKVSSTFPPPEIRYDWEVEEQLDSSHVLLLKVYPFYYDSTTTEIDFYRNHAFTVDWNRSATTITEIEPSEEVFALGEPIEGLVDVHQGSGSVMANFEVDLLDETTGEVVASMDPHAVGLDEGTTTLDFGIALAATEPSTYLLRVHLATVDELLDEATKRIRVGILSAIGEAFSVDPDPAGGFEIGELITADAWFQNNGPNPISGRARLQVVDTATAQIVAEHLEDAVIAPTAAHNAQMIWDSTPATEGTYRISAVFEYDGLSTDPMTEDVFTLRNMGVALATDRQVYGIGDKVVVWASCTDADGEPLVVTPTLWLALPDASSVPIQLTYLSNLGIYSGWHFLAAGSPTGPYGFALTADATGYHSGSAQHFFSVGGAPPTPGFTWSPSHPTAGEQVQFTDSSVGSPISWAWSFGDGTTSSSQNPVHTYGTSGDLEVTLEVTNAFGTTWITQAVTVTATAGPVFSDGFESGDCSRWSVEVP